MEAADCALANSHALDFYTHQLTPRLDTLVLSPATMIENLDPVEEVDLHQYSILPLQPIRNLKLDPSISVPTSQPLSIQVPCINSNVGSFTSVEGPQGGPPGPSGPFVDPSVQAASWCSSTYVHHDQTLPLNQCFYESITPTGKICSDNTLTMTPNSCNRSSPEGQAHFLQVQCQVRDERCVEESQFYSHRSVEMRVGTSSQNIIQSETTRSSFLHNSAASNNGVLVCSSTQPVSQCAAQFSEHNSHLNPHSNSHINSHSNSNTNPTRSAQFPGISRLLQLPSSPNERRQVVVHRESLSSRPLGCSLNVVSSTRDTSQAETSFSDSLPTANSVENSSCNTPNSICDSFQTASPLRDSCSTSKSFTNSCPSTRSLSLGNSPMKHDPLLTDHVTNVRSVNGCVSLSSSYPLSSLYDVTSQGHRSSTSSVYPDTPPSGTEIPRPGSQSSSDGGLLHRDVDNDDVFIMMTSLGNDVNNNNSNINVNCNMELQVDHVTEGQGQGQGQGQVGVAYDMEQQAEAVTSGDQSTDDSGISDMTSSNTSNMAAENMAADNMTTENNMAGDINSLLLDIPNNDLIFFNPSPPETFDTGNLMSYTPEA